MTGVMVAGLGAENSCVGRQEQGFVARITLFQTRIKGLTTLLWLPKIGKL